MFESLEGLFCGVICPAHIEPTDDGRIIVAHEYGARVKSQAMQVTGIRIPHCRDLNLHLSMWNGFFLASLTAWPSQYLNHPGVCLSLRDYFNCLFNIEWTSLDFLGTDNMAFLFLGPTDFGALTNNSEMLCKSQESKGLNPEHYNSRIWTYDPLGWVLVGM